MLDLFICNHKCWMPPWAEILMIDGVKNRRTIPSKYLDLLRLGLPHSLSTFITQALKVFPSTPYTNDNTWVYIITYYWWYNLQAHTYPRNLRMFFTSLELFWWTFLRLSFWSPSNPPVQIACHSLLLLAEVLNALAFCWASRQPEQT